MSADEPVKLIEVAEEAGVSIATASNALSDKGRISDATRERVREAAVRLGYRINPTARTLRAGHKRLVGYVMPDSPTGLTDSGSMLFYSKFLDSVMRELSASDFAVVVVTLDNAHLLTDLPIEAAFSADSASDQKLLDLGLPWGTPIITSSAASDSQIRGQLTLDIEGAVTTAFDHMLDQGAQKPALLTTLPALGHTAGAVEAFKSWAAARDIPATIIEASFSPQQTQYLVAHAVREGVDGIYSTMDMTASVIAGISDADAEIPDDVLLIAQSESGVEAMMQPPVTTLSFQPKRAGELAAVILNATLESNDDMQLTIPFELTQRRSSTRDH